MLSPFQQVSNDSTVAMLAVVAGAVPSTQIFPARALNT